MSREKKEIFFFFLINLILLIDFKKYVKHIFLYYLDYSTIQ